MTLLRGAAALLLVLLLGGPSAVQAQACAVTLQSRVDAAPAGSIVDAAPCTYRETVFVGKPITLDGHNQAVVDGDNVRDRWFWIASSDVTIRNFVMRNANTALQEGAIGTQAGIGNVTIDHNDLSATLNGISIAIGETSNSRVTNNQIHASGQLGIGTWRNQDLTISGNHVYANNTAGNDPLWGAGGIKAVQDNGLTISNNEVDHNIGPGIWIDILATGVKITGNNVHDQAWNPIFFEVSSGGEISGNTVSSSNTNSPGNWGCIIASSAANVNIHDNTCIDTFPLRAQLDNRPDVPPNAGRNIVLANNRLLRPTPPNQATSWWQYDPNGPLVPGRNGNVDSGNLIVSSLATPTPVPTATPPKKPIRCEVNVRLDGVEIGWKSC